MADDSGISREIDAAANELSTTYPSGWKRRIVDYMVREARQHARRFERMVQIISLESGKLLDIGFSIALCHLYMKSGLRDVTLVGYGEPIRGRAPSVERWTVRGAELEAHYFDIERHIAPFRDSTFDVVIFLEVLEHIAMDPMRAMAEINRVTKTGGVLILSTPNIVSYRAIDLMVKGKSPYISSQFMRSPSTDRHNREYTPDELRKLAECAGYRVDHVETSSFFSDERWFGSVADFVRAQGGSDGERGDTVILHCTKVSDVVERYPEFLYYLQDMTRRKQIEQLLVQAEQAEAVQLVELADKLRARALNTPTDHIGELLFRADMMLRAGHRAPAVQDLEAALDKPEWPRLTEPEIEPLLAQIEFLLQRVGDPELATESLRRLERISTSPSYQIMASLFAYGRGDRSAALARLQSLLTAHPHHRRATELWDQWSSSSSSSPRGSGQSTPGRKTP